MARLGIYIDLERCIGCQACVVACKTGRELVAGERFIDIRPVFGGTYPRLTGAFVHHRCFHCADAACVAVCPTGTLTKQNGLTAVQVEKCSGCGYCTDACPFGIPHLVDGHVSKCTGCYDRAAEGQEPFCVQTCPSGALEIGDHAALLTKAKAKAEQIRARYPNAQVYGETLMGGLGTIALLPDAPEALGLPAHPQTPVPVQAWQQVVQPASLGLTALSLAAAGIAFFFARREHNREESAAQSETHAAPDQEGKS